MQIGIKPVFFILSHYFTDMLIIFVSNSRQFLQHPHKPG